MNLNKEGILSCLKNHSKFDVCVLDTVDSTNNLLKAMAKEGRKEGTVIIADSQTGGRGRYDRKFYSPKGTGIYMSILLKPRLKAKDSVLITAAAAVAVNEAILKLFQKETYIKWVNDLFLNGKKVCGILTEGALNTETLRLNWAVLGIGINVYEPENNFHDEIKNIAGAIESERQPDLRNRLCAEIINRFFYYYEKIEKREFLDIYRQKSCVLGKEIEVLKNENNLKATALDIDNDCRLLVSYENGSKEYISSGEISIKTKGGCLTKKK